MHNRKIVCLFLFCALWCTTSAQPVQPSYHFVGTDSAISYASNQYKSHSFLRNFLMGSNYRKEWEQPVTLPIFRLSQTAFTIKDLGGGRQTKSLHLLDEKGEQWSLRTMEKDVTLSLPPFLRGTVAQMLMQDQISSGMPYGSLIAAALAKEANIVTAQPKPYFVADDTAFGPYRAFFTNRFCMLENRDPGFPKTVSTEVALHQIQASNAYRVNQKALLKARLMDMLLADLDRHYDNWRWAQLDSGNLHTFFAIPRDRDWAFYYSDGFVPKLARVVALRFLINFDEKPKYIISQTAKAHIFDAVFLSELDAADWLAGVQEFKQSLTDEVIENAVEKLPPPIFAISGKTFIRKLKGRRDGLEKAALEYYRYLSREMQIDGSNEADIFVLKPTTEDGFVLQQFRLDETRNNERQKIYERRFLRSETYNLKINGLGGNDRFEVDEAVKTRIKLKLNGGSGNDQYELAGKIRIHVHDDAAEANNIINKNGSKVYLR